MTGSAAGKGASALRILLVEPTATGGLAAHVRMEEELLRAAGAEVRRADVAIPSRPGPRDLRTLCALRRLLRDPSAPIDAVHAHGLRAAALAGLARGPRGRAPRLVVTLHNRIAGGRAVQRIGRILERIIRARADAVLLVSPDLGTRLAGVPRILRAVVPAPRPGALVPASGPAPAGEPGAPLSVLVVARLAPQKGLDVLLDAVARLREDGVPLDVRIAGDGPEEAALRTRIREDGLPVTLLGRRQDVPGLLAGADLVVSAARWEGQPVFLQEALRAGRPLVATDAGGTALVTGDAAVLVPPSDPEALAAAIAGMCDPAVRAEAAGRSLRRAAALPGSAEMTAQLLDVLDPRRCGDPDPASGEA
ncbi:glycosyltransferase family 4 protein [Brachybacterium hainanense]|uniref:Glycosyltransferase family 4 protein n=1 Tax=Brachybacterium hainanense TaxID=1541174 RepID=A0ABV6REI8_9MICO